MLDIPHIEEYNIYMNNVPYLTQYCNMSFEWLIKDITPDNATKSKLSEKSTLRKKAIEQSGFTENELTLICM